MLNREHWKNRQIFIMAAVGSAIGLGNLWRFPYIAAQNGGGAFLIPYFVALVSAGIPLMIIEYGLGIRSQASANIALGAIRPFFRYFGWMAILGAFVINIYYCAVLGWTWVYLFDIGSLPEWAKNIASSKHHFMVDVLSVSGNPFELGGIQWPVLAGLVATWIIIWAIIKGGLNRVGKVLLYTVPLPVILVLILVVRGLTLKGAATGLNYYLTPDWSQLTNPQVWLAAYGQIFFSLSVGFGTMITYASFMPKKTEIPNSAAITSFANCAFSFLAGFAVFSVLGYFAVASNMPVSEVAGGGPGLAFIVYPAALATLPFQVKGFGFLFFLTLLLLGIDSAFSLLETVSAAISDKFGLSRTVSTSIITGISLLLGLPFTSKAGLLWLDIVDHFILTYLITLIGILECIIVGYFLGVKRFAAEVNENAEIRLGTIFSIMIWIVTPGVLMYGFILSIFKEFQKPYEGYPVPALLFIGLGSLVLVLVSATILGSRHTKNDREWEAIESLLLKKKKEKQV
ncbi:MAG: sodium-dependent transporter [Dissulfuribacterales bacterium]